MRTLTLVATLLIAVSLAEAGESISFSTLGEDAAVLTGRVEKIQKDGVLFAMEQATTVIPWKRIHPADRYRLRVSVTPSEDAAAYKALAKTALGESYYPGARRALERALALGHKDGRAIQKLLDVVDLRECESLYAQFEEALSKQEYEAAMVVVRQMAMRFASNPLTTRARGRTSSILKARDAARRQAKKDAAQAQTAEKEAKKRAWIDARFADAESKIAKGKAAMIEGRRYHARTSLTRARKGYEAAEEAFLKARRSLLRVRRAARSGPDFDRADREIRAVERRLLDAYLGLAVMYVSQKNYKRGVIYVDRALLFDPVNPEALRLSDEIRRGRIHRSTRRLTNTPGAIYR
jgi:tetratricopeptide (TPR) repeat protein